MRTYLLFALILIIVPLNAQKITLNFIEVKNLFQKAHEEKILPSHLQPTDQGIRLLIECFEDPQECKRFDMLESLAEEGYIDDTHPYLQVLKQEAIDMHTALEQKGFSPESIDTQITQHFLKDLYLYPHLCDKNTVAILHIFFLGALAHKSIISPASLSSSMSK